MRKYYLFVINDYFYDSYKDNPLALYKTLENLYNLKDNFNYGTSLYKQICNVIDVDTLENYITNKYSNIKSVDKHNILFKDTLIKLAHPCIIIYTSKNIPNILRSLVYYSNNIFICDFNNNDYFWLSSIYTKSKVFEYN